MFARVDTHAVNAFQFPALFPLSVCEQGPLVC
jgi:hypothetical protein